MNPEVILRDDLGCHRCDGPLVLAAQVPAGWINNLGAAVTGTRTVPLCATCDRSKPSAEDLLAFCERHEKVTDQTLEEFARLLSNWLSEIGPPDIDDAELAKSVAKWQAEVDLQADP